MHLSYNHTVFYSLTFEGLELHQLSYRCSELGASLRKRIKNLSNRRIPKCCYLKQEQTFFMSTYALGPVIDESVARPMPRLLVPPRTPRLSNGLCGRTIKAAGLSAEVVSRFTSSDFSLKSSSN